MRLAFSGLISSNGVMCSRHLLAGGAHRAAIFRSAHFTHFAHSATKAMDWTRTRPDHRSTPAVFGSPPEREEWTHDTDAI
jgi:hypothetical protein